MKPVSPVIPGFEKYEIQVGAGQKQYFPIPTVVSTNMHVEEERRFISRWEFTKSEREMIAGGGSLLFEQLVFGEDSLFNPVSLSVQPRQEIDLAEFVQIMDEEPA